MIVAAAILGVLLVGIVSATRARDPILLRDDEIAHLALFFVAASGIVAILVREEIAAWAVTAVALIAGAARLRGRWLLIRATPVRAAEVVADAFGRIRVPYRVARDGVEVTLPTRTLRLLISPARAGSCALRFEGDWREDRLVLARSLLAKRFRTVLPAVTIRIGGG